MNKLSLFFCSTFIFFCQQVHCQENNSISLGEKDSIYSDTLGELRELWIYLPESAKTSINSKYPVLYLLDGDAYFYSLSGIVKQLSSFGTTICPESIIVAIPNTNRNRDLTPPDPLDSLPNLSGIEIFTSFIENELIPFVDSKYPTLPHRTLIGHSLGGSFVVNTLVNHQQLFTNYLAIDPGLKFHDNRFLNYSISKIIKGDYDKKSLFLAVANTMPENMDTVTAIKDTTWVSSTIRSTLKLARSIDNKPSNKLNYLWKFYPNENHLSIPTISQYDGLKYFFSWNSLDLDKIIRTNPDITGKEFFQKLQQHYTNISLKLKYKVLPNQDQVNDLGYYYLQKEDFDGAFQFMTLNVENFPKSSNSYDAMGDYYVAKNDFKKAAEYFSRAIKIDGNSYSKEKLENLKKEKVTNN